MFKRYSYQIVLTIIFLSVGLFQSPSRAQQSESISQDILNKINEDKDLSHFAIEVSDSPYSVIVRGEVATMQQKQAVLRISQELAGRRQIEDQINVKKDSFGHVHASDSEIRDHINSAFQQEGISGGTYEIKDGVITITGDFKTFREVDYLFSVIQNIPGVKRIVSRATVNTKDYMKEFEGRGKDFNQPPKTSLP